jgi:hypothetical protein
MKFVLPLLSAVLLVTLSACQTTDVGSPPSSTPSWEESTAAPPSSPDRPEIERGDAYKEQMLDRY